MKEQPTVILDSVLQPPHLLLVSVWYSGQSLQERPQTPISGWLIHRIFSLAISIELNVSSIKEVPTSRDLGDPAKGGRTFYAVLGDVSSNFLE